MNTTRLHRIAAALLAAASISLQAAEPAKEAPKTYALVSAIGTQMSYIRQRMQTGTSFEPYKRSTLTIPDTSLDTAVLRGMDRFFARNEPESTRVFLKLDPGEVMKAAPADREALAMARIKEELGKLPQRSGWDQIVVVTPLYQFTERAGLPGKLSGVGIFVQGLNSNKGAKQSLGTSDAGDEETSPPDGKEGRRSSKYIAFYFYTKVWVLDAKTLDVLHTEARYSDQKLYDAKWTAINMEQSMPPEELADRFESFIELASVRALAPVLGTVNVGNLKQVPAAK